MWPCVFPPPRLSSKGRLGRWPMGSKLERQPAPSSQQLSYARGRRHGQIEPAGKGWLASVNHQLSGERMGRSWSAVFADFHGVNSLCGQGWSGMWCPKHGGGKSWWAQSTVPGPRSRLEHPGDCGVHARRSRSCEISTPIAQLGPYPAPALCHILHSTDPSTCSDVLVSLQWCSGEQRPCPSSSEEARPAARLRACSSPLSWFLPPVEDGFCLRLPEAARRS